MHVMSICICETCYFRLPYDLQRRVKEVSENQSDNRLAGYLLSALKVLNCRVNLNQGAWIWLWNPGTGKSRFQREEPLNLSAEDDYTTYVNGKIS